MLPECKPETKAALASKLAEAYHALSNRGLVSAARWAVDALAGLDVDHPETQPPSQSVVAMRAKAYFDGHEYARCWHSVPNSSSDLTALFLRRFARYHAGEQIKEDQYGPDLISATPKTISDSEQSPANPYLEEIAAEIVNGPSDAHMRYLSGVLLRAKGQTEEALQTLVTSLVEYPYNWSCWMELKACFTRLIDVDQQLSALDRLFVAPEARIMLALFRSYALEELDPVVSAELLSRSLVPFFPQFLSLRTQLARIYNNEGQYDAATFLFDQALKADPYRLEDLDAYSNLLYVTEQRPKLAYLAQHVSATDKYRAESCCIVANFYSLKGEHERAVMFYQRALALNRNYLAAWTLMGHEYIELGNSQAAIETYRSAVDLAAYDFRPWFGLGQAYEVLGLHYFAQNYFQRALALRPEDVRLWDALANSYELLGRHRDALRAYEQAFQISDGDEYYSYRLGRLYAQLGDDAQALKFITACAQSDDAKPTEPLREWPSLARLWLAKRALERSEWADALQWAQRITSGTRETLEEARMIEREARVAGN